jgi:hypothetical protein
MPEALTALKHKFGDDGIFWIPYDDFLRRFNGIWRTRLFTPDWNVTQHWTTIQVPWSSEYIDTKFEFVQPKATCAVIVLSQLDTRYFRGLEGQYKFQLAFRLHRYGAQGPIVQGYSSGDLSATTEVDLEAGTYDVLLQISGQRDSTQLKVEDVVKQNWLKRCSKLMRIGLSHDLANAKGQSSEPELKAEPNVNETAVAVTDIMIAAVPANATSTDAANPSSKDAAGVLDGSALGADPATATDTSNTAPTTGDPAEDPWNAACVVSLRVVRSEG